jgi:hypothetical protein
MTYIYVYLGTVAATCKVIFILLGLALSPDLDRRIMESPSRNPVKELTPYCVDEGIV